MLRRFKLASERFSGDTTRPFLFEIGFLEEHKLVTDTFGRLARRIVKRFSATMPSKGL